MTLFLQLLTYTLTLWLGLYLMRRNWRDERLFWTGMGLLLYAGTIAALILLASGVNRGGDVARTTAPFPMAVWWLLALPALCWTGAALSFLPEQEPRRMHLARFWRYGQWPLTVLLAPLFVAAGATANSFGRPLQLLLAVVVLGPLLLVIALVMMDCLRPSATGTFGAQAQVVHSARPSPARRFFTLLLVVMPLFGLSMVALLLPFSRVAPAWIILAMGLDLLLLGFAIGGLDAFAQGETLLPDLLLSLDGALLYVLLFGGLVALTMLLATGLSLPMLALLLATIGVAVTVQALAPLIQYGLDRFALGRDASLVEERAELRVLADTLPRHDPIRAINLEDEEEFARSIRRALSHMDDLAKLSASPLIDLPIVQEQLLHNAEEDSTLARAQVLKSLLNQAIQRLKPAGDRDFDATPAWRHYNALYFPYVVGLKPYSRRALHDGLDAADQEALEWFRSQVPERTLYNWQNAAARLVAQHILETHETSINRP